MQQSQPAVTLAPGGTFRYAQQAQNELHGGVMLGKQHDRLLHHHASHSLCVAAMQDLQQPCAQGSGDNAQPEI